MADYIEFLAEDEGLRDCLHHGGAKNGRRFRVASNGPRAGSRSWCSSSRSADSASAHACPHRHACRQPRAFTALFRQERRRSGRSIDALVETAALFDLAPLPRATAW
jgi:putative hemolysin